MPGGLLNIVAYGSQNVFLNGNPSKTFFKCTYAKYTNFGLQKFRIDYNGQRKLRLTESSVFDFKVPRYGDLLMDTYLVVTLPHIWSPIIPPICGASSDSEFHTWQPYEFKWIKNIGTQMIERIRFHIGGQTIQEFTGQYLYNMVERDFLNTKKELYYKMTGNTPELFDPANAQGRVNLYPSVAKGNTPLSNELGAEPSIRSRKLYIPLNIWFTLSSKMAFPLVSLQYAELRIEVTLRPIRDLFVIRNVEGEGGYYMRPDFNKWQYQMHRFLQPPPNIDITADSYIDQRNEWNSDVHLISTYGFLSEDEIRVFAEKEQKYLVKQSYTTEFYNVVGSKKIDLKSIGMISNWMWFFQRNDVNLRNEWSNYTNWPYEFLPFNVISPNENTEPFECGGELFYPDIDLSGVSTGILITGDFQSMNEKHIMTSWALLFDGKYRENEQDTGVLNYIEKYTRTSGNGHDGLYCYNFCLHTNPYDFQPSGAINMSKFNQIEFEVKTIQPTLDPSANFITICGPDGNPIGVNKPQWNIYDYTYNLTVMEERYNILKFTSGNAGLVYTR